MAAHRLPVAWDEKSGKWKTSPGGLVPALAPVLRENGGVWVGWNGGPGGDTKSFSASGIRNRPVVLTESEIENHNDGFCSGRSGRSITTPSVLSSSIVTGGIPIRT